MAFLQKTLIAMIHVPALPGTPCHSFPMKDIIKKCVEEAKIYFEEGVDAVAIENMHDIPYLNGSVGPEIVSAMTIIGKEVKEIAGEKKVGIQILAAANKEALAIAHTVGLDFIRAEGFVFAHIADEGYIESCAGELLRYRKRIGAETVNIFTDIKKKHSSHSITSDTNIGEMAKAAEFFLSDGVIVTGIHTGTSPDMNEIKQVKEATHLPVLIGSGITAQNISRFKEYADGFIVGSYFKKDGNWKKAVDPAKVRKFIKAYSI